MVCRVARFSLAGVVFALLLAGEAAFADEVRYLAWDPQQGTALVQSAAGRQWVATGGSVPGFGQVISINETHLVLERFLTEAERAELVSNGAIPHLADQIEVLRWDLHFHGIAVRPNGNP